jgi:hypothetical protein
VLLLPSIPQLLLPLPSLPTPSKIAPKPSIEEYCLNFDTIYLQNVTRTVKPPVRSPNPKKLCIDLKIDASLNNTPANEPVVEPVTADTEDMEVDPDMDVDEVNDVEKNADPEIEEDEADEEVSQPDEEPQLTEDAGEEDDDPVDPEGEGDEDPEQDLETNGVENEQENDNEIEIENEEEPLPDGDLEDQEIELQPAHRAEALDVLASIELKFAMLRERVYVEKMEILAWEDSMVQACKSYVPFIPWLLCNIISFSCASGDAISAEGDDQTEGQAT